MNSVYATYEDISDCWPIFKHNIEGFFPLRNVHKSKILSSSDVNTLIRNIPIINLKFVPLKAELLAHKSILNLNERPHLHIFIGFCEDIDVYRQHFRPKLKSWLEAVSIRKTHQYIVILVEDQSIVNENFKNNKTFLLDKIRFDFSDKVSLKLISMKLMPGEILSTIPECINLISESIYHSTIMNLNQIDDDIRKLAAQQNNSDWNFFTFFLTKESKALALSDLGLFSEALACYDELETLFLDLNSSDEAFKFECILPFDSSICGLDLSPTNWIKFRESISQNRISLYEFKVYLLSRQIHILMELKDQNQILSRCKEFVCKSDFIEKAEQMSKNEWIFGVIFFVLKMIDFDSIQADNRQDLSNLLAEVLMLAEAQIIFNVEDVNGDNFIENLSDIPQLINLSYPLKSDKMSNFKISALRYCFKILKNSHYTHKQLMISLKLSDLYYKMKMFNTALEVLQETSDQISVKSWPLVQIVLMEKACNCYWNLNMRREYLRKYFEILIINEPCQFIEDSEFEKINQAAFELDDILSFNFDNFFSIKELSLSTDSSKDLISLDISVSSKFKMPFKKYEIELSLSGETEDVVFNSEIMTSIPEEFIIKSKLSCKNEYSEGIHKIKSVNIKIGKVEFKSENGSDIWKKDLDLLATSYLHVEAIVPKNFNFSNPSIIVRCQNFGVFDVENLTLEVAPSDLGLNISSGKDKQFIELSRTASIHSDKLACKSSFEIPYSIGNYLSGRHIIRAFTTYKRNGDTNLKTSHSMEIILPNPWIVDRFDFIYKNIDLYSLDISPDFHSDNIKILSIGTDENNQNSDFNFEIDKFSATLNFSAQSKFNRSGDINIDYLQYESVHSISIPIGKSESDIICCKCIPLTETTNIKIGLPITFKITVNDGGEFGRIPYTVNYDHNNWLLSGASSGYLKNDLSFEIVPISLGLLQRPTIVLLTPLANRLITAGSTIFVSA